MRWNTSRPSAAPVSIITPGHSAHPSSGAAWFWASSAALSHRFNENWRGGLHVQTVSSTVDAGRFSAWSTALTYTSTLPGVRLRAQALSDSRARRGHWFEGEWRDGLHASRWSLWQFDPGLYWYATLLSSGQRGLAWRHDFSDPARFWGLGFERARNAAFDALRAPTDATYVSGNAGFRIDRHLSVGVIGQWRATVPACPGCRTRRSSTSARRRA